MSGTACILYPFTIDATPPVGDYLCGGLHPRSTGVETPLYLRGLGLRTPAGRFVLAVVDYCYLCGRSQQRFVQALAAGAGVPVSQASLHSNHVHDAPLIDEEAAELMADAVPGLHNEDYFADVLARAEAAVAAAFEAEGIVATAVSFSQGRVERFASNRRVIGSDGVCRPRFSVCKDTEVRDAPEGLIDPMLDQIVLYDEADRPRVCLNFYASHPQVSDGRGLISGDTVQYALDLFERAHPGVHTLYFTGCAGDITAGKYTSPDRAANRPVFGRRLYEGMEAAFAAAQPQPLHSAAWIDHCFDLPLAPIQQGAEWFARQMEAEPLVSSKYLFAMKLYRVQHGINSWPFRISRLRFNDISILLLPAELLLRYQLHAKATSRGPVAVAAYGDCFLKYVAHDAAFDEGGYEVDFYWSEVAKGIEAPICAGIEEVLNRGNW